MRHKDSIEFNWLYKIKRILAIIKTNLGQSIKKKYGGGGKLTPRGKFDVSSGSYWIFN